MVPSYNKFCESASLIGPCTWVAGIWKDFRDEKGNGLTGSSGKDGWWHTFGARFTYPKSTESMIWDVWLFVCFFRISSLRFVVAADDLFC